VKRSFSLPVFSPGRPYEIGPETPEFAEISRCFSVTPLVFPEIL
jgi:hypothetical protein